MVNNLLFVCCLLLNFLKDHDYAFEEQLDNLEEAHQTHAKKQVQVAAQCSYKILESDFGLFHDNRVTQRVVVDADLDQIVVELDRIVVEYAQRFAGLHGALSIGARELQSVAVQRVVQYRLMTLVRTHGLTRLGHVVARLVRACVERVGALGLLGVETIGQILRRRELDQRIGAIAFGDNTQLSTEAHARVVRVRVAGGEHLVIQIAVGERLGQFAALVDRALAVLVLVLIVEYAIDGYCGTNARRDYERTGRVVERILSHVVYEHVDALELRRAVRARDEWRVGGQPGVEIESQAVVDEARAVGHFERTGVAIEAVAVQISRMEYPVEVVRPARVEAEGAVDKKLVQVAQHALLVVGHVAALSLLGVLLNCRVHARVLVYEAIDVRRCHRQYRVQSELAG